MAATALARLRPKKLTRRLRCGGIDADLTLWKTAPPSVYVLYRGLRTDMVSWRGMAMAGKRGVGY